LGYVANNFDEDNSKIPGDDLRTYTIVPTIGKTGIEAAFDEELSGESGVKIWIVDLAGYKYEMVRDIPPSKGKDVVSSLDIDIQQAIEESFGTRKGAAVMLDVKTGEVLCLVRRPSYDPNTVSP
jgi:penicillin-binding protein 2